MIPSTKKSKFNKHHRYYDLTEAAHQYRDAVQNLPRCLERLPDDLVIVKPLLTSITKAFECTETDISATVYRASNLTIYQTVKYLSIDYDDDEQHMWALEAGRVQFSKEEPISPWACR